MLKLIVVILSFLNICLAQTFVERLIQDCDNNESFACGALVNEYAHGDEKEGIKPDTGKMLEYGIKACDINLFYCDKLALIYEHGVNGVAKDMAKAIAYYKMRCDSKYEDLETCQKVGDAYAKGDG
ncbi:MAG: hypothetical protein LBC09_01555, partial [Helicobacteraceae bacterium]|nr:hypothetical protein [Helicobacteraceae bacterium]